MINPFKSLYIYIIGFLVISLLSTKLYYTQQENRSLKNTLKIQNEVNTLSEQQNTLKTALKEEFIIKTSKTQQRQFISKEKNFLEVAKCLFTNFNNENEC